MSDELRQIRTILQNLEFKLDYLYLKEKEKENKQRKRKRNYISTHKVDSIFFAYKKLIKITSRKTLLAENVIKKVLELFAEDDLLLAIQTKSKDEWFMKNNARRGISWFFESKKRVNNYIEEGLKDMPERVIDRVEEKPGGGVIIYYKKNPALGA